MAFVTNGYCSLTKKFYDDETNLIIEGREEILFDANIVIQNFFKIINSTNIEANFISLVRKIKESYEQATARMIEENLGGNFTPTPPGQHLFQTLFFSADKAKRIRVYEITAKRGGLERPTL